MIVFSLGDLNFYNKGFKSRYAEDFKNFSINFNIKELEQETALFKENLRLKNEFYRKKYPRRDKINVHRNNFFIS